MVTRRDFIKKASYTAPVVLTLSATPAFAGNGSNRAKGIQGQRDWIPRRRRWGREIGHPPREKLPHPPREKLPIE